MFIQVDVGDLFKLGGINYSIVKQDLIFTGERALNHICGRDRPSKRGPAIVNFIMIKPINNSWLQPNIWSTNAGEDLPSVERGHITSRSDQTPSINDSTRFEYPKTY